MKSKALALRLLDLPPSVTLFEVTAPGGTTMRPYCYLPAGGGLVETCTRTIHGRLLLRPDRHANEIMLGVLGRALHYYPVDFYGFSFQSNHYHLLIGAETSQQMARFQGYFNGNLAKKMCKYRGWSDKFWARRYRPMAISNEPEAQLARLKYVLANGTKEGLVASPLDWPGPNMAQTILHDETLVGHWFNQSKEWAARRRGEDFDKYDYATRYEIQIQRLPAFRDLTEEEYKGLVANLVAEIESEAAELRKDRPVLGRHRVLAADPQDLPKETKNSPAPMLFFARSKQVLDEMKTEYRDFATQYRQAADRLLAAQTTGSGLELRSGFPRGSFPPALQFLGEPVRSNPSRPPSRLFEYDQRSRMVRRGEIPIVSVPRAEVSASPRATAAVAPKRGNDPPI